jgi:hypothetical protein
MIKPLTQQHGILKHNLKVENEEREATVMKQCMLKEEWL